MDVTASPAELPELPGIDLPLRPFLGIMGVAPATGPLRTIEPGPHGGNLDCRDLGVGSRLYLPVQVAGASLPSRFTILPAMMTVSTLAGVMLVTTAPTALFIGITLGRS